MIGKIRLIIFLLLFGISGFISGFTGGFNDVKFIAHRPLYFSEIDEDTIYNIYTLNIEIDEYGNPITLVHMPEYSIEYKLFVKDFLNMNVRSYKHLLKSNSSVGRGIYVKHAKSEWDMINIVEDTPSSIGYVNPFIYINGGDNGIKVININSSYH